MYSVQAALWFIPLLSLGCFASPLLKIRDGTGILQVAYNDFVQYAKYSSAAYHDDCPSPLGNTLVQAFNQDLAHAYVARDDTRKEIVIAYRGTFNIEDIITDIDLILTPFNTPGISASAVGNASVHSGFLNAYNAVASDILSTVQAQVNAYPGYSIVSTGHSLGGAEAALAGVAYKAAIPNVPVRLYTFGQPRTGNAAFASFVENTLGTENIFRTVHTIDGVPTILPVTPDGYRHFGPEFWNFEDPAQPSSVKQCTTGDGEDPTCSDSIPSTGINPAHPFYFGQVMSLDLSLCS